MAWRATHSCSRRVVPRAPDRRQRAKHVFQIVLTHGYDTAAAPDGGTKAAIVRGGPPMTFVPTA
jgi:hypothetical protein